MNRSQIGGSEEDLIRLSGLRYAELYIIQEPSLNGCTVSREQQNKLRELAQLIENRCYVLRIAATEAAGLVQPIITTALGHPYHVARLEQGEFLAPQLQALVGEFPNHAIVLAGDLRVICKHLGHLITVSAIVDVPSLAHCLVDQNGAMSHPRMLRQPSAPAQVS